MCAGGEALAAAGAALAKRLLQAAEAARHARRPLRLVPVGGLLVAQVAREALAAAREAQPPAIMIKGVSTSEARVAQHFVLVWDLAAHDSICRLYSR